MRMRISSDDSQTSMTVQKRMLAGGEMAVVVVEPSAAPPFGSGVEPGYVSAPGAVATPEEERRLCREAEITRPSVRSHAATVSVARGP